MQTGLGSMETMIARNAHKLRETSVHAVCPGYPQRNAELVKVARDTITVRPTTTITTTTTTSSSNSTSNKSTLWRVAVCQTQWLAVHSTYQQNEPSPVW
ncbi:hypothetical protein M0804_008502 [Polistes exclamans]|nr:hypothetical protein M0804_008502 [Polistes exclamans]